MALCCRWPQHIHFIRGCDDTEPRVDDARIEPHARSQPRLQLYRYDVLLHIIKYTSARVHNDHLLSPVCAVVYGTTVN